MTEEELSPPGDEENLRHELINSEKREKEPLVWLQDSDDEQKRKDQESQRKRYEQDTKSKRKLVDFIMIFAYMCYLSTFVLLLANHCWWKISDSVLTTFVRAVFANNILGLVGIVLLHFFPKRETGYTSTSKRSFY
jgi:hypothetical protein